MPTLDVFNQDAFSLQSLTAAINAQPYKPGRIGQLGLFGEQGINTTVAVVESVNGTLSLVANQPRGVRGGVVSADKRKARSFIVPHLPTSSTIMADEVQSVRAFGTESELQSVQAIVNQRLAEMSSRLDVTLEHHRIGAIKGQILDSDGVTVIYNLFTEFGVTQQTQAMALTTATTKVREKVMAAKRKVEDALGGDMYTGIRVLCGSGFFDALTNHELVKEAYANWQTNEFLRQDVRGGFLFAGVIWEEYRGSVGGVDFIGADDAYMVPEGVPGLLITRFAPADYMETVNTLGLPKYTKQERIAFDRGVELDGQSNPLNLCTRPRAVVKLTKV